GALGDGAGQCLALQKLHGEVQDLIQAATFHEQIEDMANVGMGDLARQADFAAETRVDVFLSAKARAQDLQRDDIREFGVFRAVAFAHAAAAHQFDQAKAAVVEDFTGPELSGLRLAWCESRRFQEISQALVLRSEEHTSELQSLTNL